MPAAEVATISALHAREGGLLAWERLLALLAADVEWYVLGDAERLPFAGVFRGRDGVERWAALLNEHAEYTAFELREILDAGDAGVVEVIRAAGRGRATGRAFESDVVRIWSFADGAVVRVRSYYDTAAYERALSA